MTLSNSMYSHDDGLRGKASVTRVRNQDVVQPVDLVKQMTYKVE